MTKVTVLGKTAFDGLMSKRGANDFTVVEMPFRIISIIGTCFDDDWHFFSPAVDHRNVLNLTFDDVDGPGEFYSRVVDGEEVTTELVPFSDTDARRVIEFIRGTTEPELIVHCQAGRSRSGAIGRFAADLLGDRDFVRRHQQITPNAHVLVELGRAMRREQWPLGSV